MTLAGGTRLGSYEILAPLGAGGMGEVYRARHRKLDRDVAIKVLPDSVAADPEALARFEREAKAVAAISHPNILAIHDFGTHNGTSYAVMELLEGDTLRGKLEAGPIPQKQAVDYALQIAKGLSAAHERGVVHRDLKPENLFVTKDGHLKILDFGLAKRVEQVAKGKETSAPTASGHTTPGTVMGTVGYMSPEQVRGLPVDHRSDIFSFGAILYEMLSGQRAFKRDTASDSIAAIMRDEPPDLSESDRNVSPALNHVVRHCLEKDCENRFQTARDIVFALGEAASSSPAVTGENAVRRIRKRKRFAALAFAALAVCAAAGLLILRRLPSASNRSAAASIAVLPFTNLSGDQTQEYFSDGMAEELIGLLAKVRQLRVVGRISSFSFKGKKEDLASISRQLGVSTILEGSVRRSGDGLRVTTELVNASDGFQVWGNTYDRKVSELTGLEEEIAAAVLDALNVKLQPQERPKSRGGTSNADAYDQYLLGLHYYGLANGDDYVRAIAAFEEALRLDPNFAQAAAGLSWVLAQVSDYTASTAELSAMNEKALSAAQRAVEIDPGLADGWEARANARTYNGYDWAGAEADFRKALALNPAFARTHAHYGRLLARLGRLPEAIEEAKKAADLEPLWPAGKNILGCYYNAVGRLREARQVLTTALGLSPRNEYANYFLGETDLLEGKAKDVLARCTPATSPFRKAMVSMAEHDLGHSEASQKALEELIVQSGETHAFQIAQVYERLGQPDRAFEWLDKAYAHRESQLPTMVFDPLLAPLRQDPHYLAMLKKLNLPIGR